MALRGRRNMDGGKEQIEDPSELEQVRRQASRVYLKTTVVAAALTVLCVVISG